MNHVLETNFVQIQSRLKVYEILVLPSFCMVVRSRYWNKGTKDSKDVIDETHSRV